MNKDLKGLPLKSMFPDELKTLMADLGQPGFRADQVFHFFHVEEKDDFSQSSNLPKDLCQKLESWPSHPLEVVQVLKSEDGSKKYLFRLHDGGLVESVYMPYPDRTTLCLSSQVGCRMNCAFCASSKADFVRNLGADEMLGQFYEVEKREGVQLTNLVIMGVGEPLDNYQNLVRFLKILTHPNGRDLSRRSITLSTSGLVPAIYALAESGLGINLAISLHATNDRDRQKIMPIAKKYPLADLMEAASTYFDKTGRRVSFEYMLIRAFNDQREDLDWLGDQLAGKKYHLNLIPLNEIKEFDIKGDGPEEIARFEKAVRARGVQVSTRKRRGADVDAACGQLRILYQESKKSEGCNLNG